MQGPDGRGSAADGYHDGIDMYDDTDDIQIGLGVHRGDSDIGDGEDGDHSDGDDDDLLDDELMDKISSSPSIDDGMLWHVLLELCNALDNSSRSLSE